MRWSRVDTDAPVGRAAAAAGQAPRAPRAREISRRGVVAGGWALAALPLLAACGQAGGAGGQEGANPSQPRTEVKLVAFDWVINEWGLPKWIEQYNKLGGPTTVSLEQTPDGWQPKVLAMIRDGSLAWDGIGIMSTPADKVNWAESGTSQPIDQYVQASKTDGAKNVVADLVPTIKQDISYKGQLQGLPYSVEAIGFMWYTQYLQGIGMKEPPATWDDMQVMATKLLSQYRSQEVVPLGWPDALHTSLMALIYASTDKPFTADGLLDVTGQASMRSLRFMKTLVDGGMTPPKGSDGYLDLWQRSKLATLVAQNSRGVWAQRIFGPDKADTTTVPVATRGGPQAGTYFWNNTFAVFKGAKHPQELVDFYLWLLSPKNEPVQQAIIDSGKAPVYNSVYTAKIQPNAGLRWMATFRDLVAKSVPYPENAFRNLQNSKIMPWLQKYLDKGSTISPEDAMNSALVEVKEEVAKQVVK
jgi:ABC-type glycerol-3-phosphate transport system substrate-binding protein